MYNDYQQGIRVVTQQHLDGKTHPISEAVLKDLGPGNRLAFSYPEGLICFSVAEKTAWEWREVTEEDGPGLLDDHFTYPSNTVGADGITYSNRTFNFFLKPQTLDLINLTNLGFRVYKGFNQAQNRHEFYSLDTSSFIMRYEVEDDGNGNMVETGRLLIDIPRTASIPAIYVNNLYVPTREDFLLGKNKGDGTIGKPFTDTIASWPENGDPVITPNTAMNNAFIYWAGGNPLNPVNKIFPIIVQSNNGMGYVYAGTLSASDMKLFLEENVEFTNAGKLLDMDNPAFFDATTAHWQMDIARGKFANVHGLGLFNGGNLINTTTYASGRIAYLSGEGTLLSQVDDVDRSLINSNETAVVNTNNNDGNVTFQIECKLRADKCRVWTIGGKSKIDIYNQAQSGLLGAGNEVDVNLKAFHQLGGQVRLFKNAILGFEGGMRTNVVTFDLASGRTATFVAFGATFSGQGVNLFKHLTAVNAVIEVTNSPSGYGLNITKIFDNITMLNPIFKDNTFQTGLIDVSIVDLTGGNDHSVVNTIGNNVIATYVKHPSRTAAALLLPPYAMFINTNNNNVSHATWFLDSVIP